MEVAQYIKFGELTPAEKGGAFDVDTGMFVPQKPTMAIKLPDSMSFEQEVKFSKDEEDALVVGMSAQFADWVAAFLRRLITLFENLPEEGGTTGAAGGQTEGGSNAPRPPITVLPFCSQPCGLSLRRVQPDLRSSL